MSKEDLPDYSLDKRINNFVQYVCADPLRIQAFRLYADLSKIALLARHTPQGHRLRDVDGKPIDLFERRHDQWSKKRGQTMTTLATNPQLPTMYQEVETGFKALTTLGEKEGEYGTLPSQRTLLENLEQAVAKLQSQNQK